MKKHLFIAGHGLMRNGRIDPGATGIITKGEHRYMVEDLFPAINRHLPKGHNIEFFTAHKVVDYGDLATLAKKYNADQVTEFHYDAASAAARGGHVIIHSDFIPDKTDLALRDAIKSMVGVRYSHKGYEGISGRTNLGNVNRAKTAGITYRLLELGFGTNKTDADIMINQVDDYAKAIIKAVTGKQPSSPKVSKPTPTKTGSTQITKPSNKSITAMADEVIAGEHGSGHDNRRDSLGISKSEYEKVRAEVNRKTGTTSKPAQHKYTKTINQMAKEVLAGKHGTGHESRRASLKVNQSTYNKVRAEVNKLAAGGKSNSSSGKSISQMATEVIKGVHGSGHENRRQSLGISISEYEKVRKEVNKRL